MSNRIAVELAGMTLGQAATIEGVRVVRASLFGYRIGAAPELVDAGDAARRIASALRRPQIRVVRCGRCGGDGLGRRDRGACGLCHGPGVQLVVPPGGWADALPAEIAAALEQALVAIHGACAPRARQTLRALLDELLPLAPPALRERAAQELAPRGLVKTGSRPPEARSSSRP